MLIDSVARVRMPKRPYPKASGGGGGGSGGGGGGRASRAASRRRAAEQANANGRGPAQAEEEAAVKQDHKALGLLEPLPDGVLRTILSFLSGGCIGNFCHTCKAAAPFFHCINDLVLANASSLPSLIRRIQNEGILRLRSLQFDYQVTERLPATLPTPGDVLEVLVRNSRRVPQLEELDMGDVVVYTRQVVGIHNLTSLKSLTLPGMKPSSTGPGDDTRHNNLLHEVGREIISLPRLERLGLGRMPWATWTTSAILMIPEPIRHDHTDLNVVRAQAMLARLRELDLSLVHNLEDNDVAAVLSLVREGRMPSLTDLNLSFADQLSTPLAPMGLEVRPRLRSTTALADAWKAGALKTLQVLDLSYQFNPGNNGLKDLCDGWLTGGKQNCSSLQRLRLRDAALGRYPDRNVDGDDPEEGCWNGLNRLGRVLEGGLLEGLVELDLQDNFLSLHGTECLAKGMALHGSLPNLECLDLSVGRDHLSRRERRQAAMGRGGIRALVESLTHSGLKLKRLGLGGHLIGQEGCRSLFEGMDRGALPCLEQLDLSANRIGESGAFWLSNWLAKGTRPTLQRLLLGENNISGIIFHEAGPPTTVPRHKLLEVQLDQNMLGDVPLDSLLRRLLSPSILRLNLSRNYDLGTQANATASLGGCLSSFPKLQCLDLSRCGRHKYLDIKAMVRAIDKPLPLTVLGLARCHMGIRSLEALLQAHQRFPHLAELEVDGLSSNCIRMLKALLTALKKGHLPSLQSLTFTCRAVGDGEAWRQHRLAYEIEKLRPWLRAYISWPTPQEEAAGGGDQDDDDDDDDDEEDDAEWAEQFFSDDDFDSDDDDDDDDLLSYDGDTDDMMSHGSWDSMDEDGSDDDYDSLASLIGFSDAGSDMEGEGDGDEVIEIIEEEDWNSSSDESSDGEEEG